VLQPLDLGVFGPFKVLLAEEAFAYEFETGHSVEDGYWEGLELSIHQEKHYICFLMIWNLAIRLQCNQHVGKCSFQGNISGSRCNPLATTIKRVIQALDELSLIKAPVFEQPHTKSMISFLTRVTVTLSPPLGDLWS